MSKNLAFWNSHFKNSLCGRQRVGKERLEKECWRQKASYTATVTIQVRSDGGVYQGRGGHKGKMWLEPGYRLCMREREKSAKSQVFSWRN